MEKEEIKRSPCNTLYDTVNELMALHSVNIKKYMASYLIAAKQAWQELFWNTLFVTNSVWKTLQRGEKYSYITTPRDSERILYIGVEDHCGDVKPLYYNSRLNVVEKPKEKKCGCESCECSGLCEDLNSTIFTTRVLFTINGVDYVEKTWIKYSKNGDIIEYKEVPTKSFNDRRGNPGDFNNDQNSDFSMGSDAFANFDIVTEKFQRKICALETYPCGCPVDNPENEELVLAHCSCFIPFFGKRRHEHCDHFLRNENISELGEVKISQCGTKIYYVPPKSCHKLHKNRIPEFLQITYQTNGNPAQLDQQIQVPEYAKKAIWAGTMHYRIFLNPQFTLAEKQAAKYAKNSEINDLIGFLNPLSLKDLSDAQDAPVRW